MCLGVVQNSQHYQKRTQKYSFCDPLPLFQKNALKMLILTISYENAMHHNKHFKIAYGHPSHPAFATFVKMMTILDDHLLAVVLIGLCSIVLSYCLQCWQMSGSLRSTLADDGKLYSDVISRIECTAGRQCLFGVLYDRKMKIKFYRIMNDD